MEYSPESKGITLKVMGGTPSGTGNLCRTCSNALVVRGLNNQQIIKCLSLGRQVGFEVAECSSYLDRDKPTLYDMESIAWQVVTKGGGRTVGFVSPKDFRRIEEREDNRPTPAQPPGF